MQETFDQIQKVDSMEEVEQIVYSQIKNGKNYREILKMKFLVNDKIIGLNVSKINEIKDKFEGKSSKQNRDPDKALVFKYFKQGMKPSDVIIKTDLNYEYVKKSYEEFLEFEKTSLVPEYWLDNLENFADYVTESDGKNKLGHIHYAFSVAKSSHLELEKHIFVCVGCRKVVPIRDNALKAAAIYLSKDWGHSECLK